MQSFEIAIFLQFFLGLVAAVNPVGIMPVFVSLTGHMTLEEKNKTAATANIAVAIILIIALLAGQMLLDLFSISLDSFRVAGGLLLLSIAFSMMSGKLGEDKQNKQEKSEYISREQIAVVPLAMPLMALPRSHQFNDCLWLTLSKYAGYLGDHFDRCRLQFLLLAAFPFSTVYRPLARTNRYQRNHPYHGSDPWCARY